MNFNYNENDTKIQFAEFEVFLMEVDDDFIPPLRNRVNFRDYYNKLKANACFATCRIDGMLVGLCVFYANNLESKAAYITYLAVKKEFRGQHIAGNLLDLAVSHSKKRGLQSMGIHTNNSIAKRCYEKNGFIIVDYITIDNNITRYFLEKTI